MTLDRTYISENLVLFYLYKTAWIFTLEEKDHVRAQLFLSPQCEGVYEVRNKASRIPNVGVRER